MPRSGIVRAALLSIIVGATSLAAEETGWYLEAQAGTGTLDTQFGAVRTKFFDEEASTVAVEVGYDLHRHLALQAGFHDLGTFTGNGALCRESAEFCIESLIQQLLTSIPGIDPEAFDSCAETGVCGLVAVPLSAEVSAWSLSAVPKLPLSDRVTLRGRLGVIAWETDISASFGLGRFDSFSGEEVVAGLGVEVGLVERLAAIVEYRTTGLDLDSVSAGLAWKFHRP